MEYDFSQLSNKELIELYRVLLEHEEFMTLEKEKLVEGKEKKDDTGNK